MKSGKQLYDEYVEAQFVEPTATDADLDYLRNINTRPGPGVGQSIDPTKPGPTAPSPATSPGPQDVREALSRAIDETLTAWANANVGSKKGVEWRITLAGLGELRALLTKATAALAQSDAQPFPQPLSAGLMQAAEHLTASADQIKGQAEKLRAVGTDECNEQAGELEIIEPCLRAEANYLRALASVQQEPAPSADAEATVLRKRFAEYLVPAYLENQCLIAQLCDEQLDRSGALLGYLREAAARAKLSEKGGAR